MKAMIFAAGLGTRFKPWTDEHPKALAMVNGKSLLQRNVEYFQRFGIREVIINVHHFANQIYDAVKKSNGWGSTIYISDEQDQLLDTGGGLMKVKKWLDNKEPFVTTNADILTDLDLNKLIAFHKQHQPLISLAVTQRKTSRYFLFDENNRLCGWRNTKTGEEKIAIKKKGLVEKAYSCVVVFDPKVFSLISFTGKFSLIDAYLSLAKEHIILGYDHTGDKLVDVGKPESIAIAESLFP
ncbi:MAG TPA: sugar phosphate nucleotidyltransferase [Chitinophagaceae bacterium]|nr:sugar phosphate nucleotidyltransferase [Chitinophagaceae bacterium]